MAVAAYRAVTESPTSEPAGTTSTPVGTTPTPVGTTPIVDDAAVDYPHEIVVANSLVEALALTVSVERDGTVLYREEHAVPAGADTTVAGITRENRPEGSRSLTVEAVEAVDASGQSASVQVTVTDCLGDVVFSFGEQGDLQGTYSIC